MVESGWFTTSLPTGNESVIGHSLPRNNTFQYKIYKKIWPEPEVNFNHFYGGNGSIVPTIHPAKHRYISRQALCSAGLSYGIVWLSPPAADSRLLRRPNAAETYSGVLLATLLAKVSAPLGRELHGEAMATYVTATGSDGYAVALSLAEVDPSFHEGHVLVADAREGQPLGKFGPFQPIVSEDKRPARWVRNLVSITLQRAP